MPIRTMWRFAAIVTVLLGPLIKGELPEDDFRIINKEDLLASDTDIFEDIESKSFSQLLFDVARDQVIVGARDNLYRLSLRGLRQIERASWPAPVEKAKMCQVKGQTEDDCHNYIKVLLTYGHKLFACGTNAFSPECSWREIESLNTVSESVTGVASCPYNPHSNVTAVLTSSGEYFAGTPTDFSGSDTAIYRSRGASVHNSVTLRTTQYDLNWLNEPQFVGSFEDDTYVYFVFREIAVEHMNCGNIIYSRIARVCKNDPGGYLMMKEKWSTFLKARLQCSVPGDVPFNYDEVQSVEYLIQEKVLVASFTTPSNSIAGSAVCLYNMSDIHAAFDGPYKVQESQRSIWESRMPSNDSKERFRCVARHESVEYDRYYLMHEPIKPISGQPVYRVTSQRFTHITADVTSAKNVYKQYVVYVATQNSNVLKLSILPELKGACLVEIWRLEDGKGGFDVLSMQFVKDTMSVYIGSTSAVLRIGSARCSRHQSLGACVSAADPHCGWDPGRAACLRPTHATLHYLQQDTTTCTGTHSPVDGGWGAWSSWERCMQDGTPSAAYSDAQPDMCLCRTRSCNNPTPANGGKPCQGTSISVSNCTVHGAWSAWSPWSACTATCGLAVKSRRRACVAPAPRHGGRVCVGLDNQDMICNNLPPCPDPALAPIDGGWSAWSSWSACTPSAGGCGAGAGMRERHRTCTNPQPRNGGGDCEGTKVDRQVCDMKPCEIRKATAWTPWVQIPSNISAGSYTEKRFKFTCKAPSSEQIRISLAREEERYCTAVGSCSNTPPEEDGWEAWGPWGECTSPCGGGQQKRERKCRRPPCVGAPDMLRACNVQACEGEWSCWSEWSECSGGCEEGALTGHRARTRQCLSPEGCADAGAALERRICVNNCEESTSGWGEWGPWSDCSGGERVRRRRCGAPSGTCAGPALQVALCDTALDHNDIDNELHALPAYTQNVEMASFVTMNDNQTLSLGAIIGCVVASFVLGCLVCLAAVIICQKRSKLWKRQTRVPSSPHYITAKQNSYVTVPLKDVPRKAKRQPSFTGIGGSSGLVLPKSNNINVNHNTGTTPKLYPKAIANEYDSMGTLRRHSNQPSHKNNLDVEEDKFY